jgi:hypothetical protein
VRGEECAGWRHAPHDAQLARTAAALQIAHTLFISLVLWSSWDPRLWIALSICALRPLIVRSAPAVSGGGGGVRTSQQGFRRLQQQSAHSAQEDVRRRLGAAGLSSEAQSSPSTPHMNKTSLFRT